ncbi:MAG: DUF6095 family protein [Flavobacteriaceae bacterium]|nr:DUF6095 family protein [Flavobacteriaceae bacterium]|tara:strand:- start:197 stop:421 length:225 start_codon:yes stop_codon:yes gene_type:complete
MSQKHTDTKKLAKGIKYLVFTLPLLFLSPYLLTLSFLNKDNLSFYFFLLVGIAMGILAILLFFRALRAILDSIF